MNLILTVFFSIIIAQLALCQSTDQSLVQKCVYQLKDLDKFSGKHIFHTKDEFLWQNGMKGNSIAFSAKRNGDDKSLLMAFSCRELNDFDNNGELHFLLEDGSVLVLKCKTIHKTQREAQFNIHYPEYQLNDSNIEQLMTNGITDIQFFLKKGKVRKEIIAKNKLVIADMLQCIL